MAIKPFIKINGQTVPTPSRGLDLQVSTLVTTSRNANAVMVGQKAGRDQQKINGLQWNYLSAADWSTILKACDNFFMVVEYPDMVNNQWTRRKMYCGDRSATPMWLDDDTASGTGLPKYYINCKVNLIDVGEAVLE